MPLVRALPEGRAKGRTRGIAPSFSKEYTAGQSPASHQSAEPKPTTTDCLAAVREPGPAD